MCLCIQFRLFVLGNRCDQSAACGPIVSIRLDDVLKMGNTSLASIANAWIDVECINTTKNTHEIPSYKRMHLYHIPPLTQRTYRLESIERTIAIMAIHSHNQPVKMRHSNRLCFNIKTNQRSLSAIAWWWRCCRIHIVEESIDDRSWNTAASIANLNNERVVFVDSYINLNR